MKIFTAKQIQEIDAYTIQNEPIASIDLMERASQTCTEWIEEAISTDQKIKIVAGIGNNGGDGLAIARQLSAKGYDVDVVLIKIGTKLSPDAATNLKKIKAQKKVVVQEVSKEDQIPVFVSSDIIIDAIFGTGLSRPVEGLAFQVIKAINNSKALIISIDVPSGLFTENNNKNTLNSIIKADITLTFEFPKLSFLYSDNYPFVGEWVVLPIGLHKKAIESQNSTKFLLNEDFISQKVSYRETFSHKGTYGHALLISGSYGKMGAAILSSEACLRTGTGLLTVHVPKIGNRILQTSVPEAMLSIDSAKEEFSSVPDLTKYTAIGVGPGIGTSKKTTKALNSLISSLNKPIVIDADGLNILAQNKNILKKVPEESILTPHPKEFEKLAGKAKDARDRNIKQIDFACKHSVYVILKGAHTSIACPDGSCFFNTTGNPGMATAGSGDVLTGIILSLLAQDYSPKDAALIGVYLHGLAGDLTLGYESEESLIARDIISSIGLAYTSIRELE